MTVRTFTGDCRAIMAASRENSIDAIVCDPPYELSFMGKKWDSTGVAFDRATWRAAYRVLKPGGYLLAFGGTRTVHRIACAIEDAGFEIRDQIIWMYGQGFPKSHNISKAIDRAAGAEREVVGEYTRGLAMHPGNEGTDNWRENYTGVVEITTSATPESAQWEGWGTALKPSHEPIVVARKPFSGTVAANVLLHGTGAINIDGCRIAGEPVPINKLEKWSGFGQEIRPAYEATVNNAGRWPANVILDEDAARLLDEQSGNRAGSGPHLNRRGAVSGTSIGGLGRFGTADYHEAITGYGDSGGASRFFYCAKANKRERSANLPEGMVNDHATVKPVEVMRWLVRLVTPPGGLVLDPFMGSGTTGVAAVAEGFDFIGIEQDPKSMRIAQGRLGIIEVVPAIA